MLGFEKRELEDGIVEQLEEALSEIKGGYINNISAVRDELPDFIYHVREKAREVIERLDDAELELKRISELVGPGGDGSPFGRVESMLSALTAERDAAVAGCANLTVEAATALRERDEARAQAEKLRADLLQTERERDEATMAPDGLAALFGTLFEFVLEHSGGPFGHDPEEWLQGCYVPATALRDRLVALAVEHPFAWREMQLSRQQMRWLGIPTEDGAKAG